MTAWLSLFALIIVIILGTWKGRNCGIAGLAMAFLLGFFVMNDDGVPISGIAGGFKVILGGMSYALLGRIIMVAILFGISEQNGTLSILAHKVARLVRGKSRFIPWVMYIIITAICFAGGGGQAAVLILTPLACTIAVKEGLDPAGMAAICYMAICGGSCSPYCAIGMIINNTAEAAGIDIGMHAAICGIITFTISAVIFYFAFKMHKVPDKPFDSAGENYRFNGKQICTLLGILLFTIVVLMKYEIMVAAALLIVILLFVNGKDVDERSLIAKSVPWYTVVLIMGMSMFITVFSRAGGVQLLVNMLNAFMTPRTAPTLMGLIGGLLSTVSSAAGVVYPTVIPTVPGLAQSLGVNPIPLVVGVGLGGCASSISPMSDGGSMMLGAIGQAGGSNYDHGKAFTTLLLCAIVNVVLFLIYGLIGLFAI